MKNRIEIKDPNFFPVQAFLNAIPDEQFSKTLENIAKGIGATFNDVDCSFPEDIDPNDEPFEGVSFSIFDEEVIISLEEFLIYLHQATDQYIAQHPSERDDIIRLVNRFSSKVANQ